MDAAAPLRHQPPPLPVTPLNPWFLTQGPPNFAVYQPAAPRRAADARSGGRKGEEVEFVHVRRMPRYIEREGRVEMVIDDDDDDEEAEERLAAGSKRGPLSPAASAAKRARLAHNASAADQDAAADDAAVDDAAAAAGSAALPTAQVVSAARSAARAARLSDTRQQAAQLAARVREEREESYSFTERLIRELGGAGARR